MTHVDEGLLLAIRDGELVSADHRLHVDSCTHCQDSVAAARHRSERIVSALAAVSQPVDVDAAKRAVRARMDAQSTLMRPRRSTAQHLGRAAAILLVAAGAAYALPGSPVRTWLDPGSRAFEVVPAPVVASPATEAGGIEVAVGASIVFVLNGVPEGTRIEVVWLDEALARLSAPTGSTYSFADGRIEATLTPGRARIEVPRAPTVVSISVNGRMVMQGSSDEAELFGVIESDEQRIVLSAPGR